MNVPWFCRFPACRFPLLRWIVLPLLSLALQAEPPADPAERLAWLRAEIARHDDLYFRRADPEITDSEYDALKRELRDLSARAAATEGVRKPPAAADDRTGRFSSKRHGVPMRGLTKAYTAAELRDFLARVARESGAADVRFIVEPKYDGMAFSATYADGRLVRVLTRGDGATGEDITDTILACTALPRTLAAGTEAAPALVELRGEAFVDDAEFARLNRLREDAGAAPFAHPRNLAAGTLQSLDAAAEHRRLSVVFFGWGACEPAASAPAGESDLLARLRAWGLPSPATAENVAAADVAAAVERVAQARGRLGFPIDGAVVKVESAALRAKLGETAEGPRWAIAYKFAAEQVYTRLLAITLQVGRTGLITPVAELAPVRLGGVMVTRASLHNREQIARRDIRVGDFVRVERAGDVIPVVLGADPSLRPPETEPYAFPTSCPACGTPLADAEGAARIRCPNHDCPAQLRRRLEYFASPSGVDLAGFGPALIDQLVQAGRLHDPADFYRLTAADLRLAGRSAEPLFAAIAATRTAELRRFIRAFGLPGVGPATAERAARHFRTLAALAGATEADWRAAGLGATQAARVVQAQREAGLAAVIAKLEAAGVKPAMPGPGKLAGWRVCFVGRLEALSPGVAERLVREAGGTVTETLAARTDLLVVVGAGAEARRAEAERLGVRIVNESELRAWLGEP
jgi:DNA ligase (NAD+)